MPIRNSTTSLKPQTELAVEWRNTDLLYKGCLGSAIFCGTFDMHNLPSVGPKIPFSRKTSRLRVRLTTWGRSKFTMTRLIIVGLQLLGSSVTLAFWAAHQVTESAWAPSSLRHTPTRATFTLFVVYTAMAPIWMLCLFLDVYRKGTPASRLVVELAWVAALGAYHGCEPFYRSFQLNYLAGLRFLLLRSYWTHHCRRQHLS
ncbi:hypothetical protein BOTBODRAFT_295152 [Botryobasidium botryosum FD-172 SS1]|uniref:Uncharacterized protein n=1 Tax=Botryobasidium botryosum (strain FD-172 SS1) TaxID=930990 RepID=A0A067LU81_BOTB1|nr:hypothetical protein BOTBODRAFT_295152 [Botryobasidium botryosum FD-172 SS1]